MACSAAACGESGSDATARDATSSAARSAGYSPRSSDARASASSAASLAASPRRNPFRKKNPSGVKPAPTPTRRMSSAAAAATTSFRGGSRRRPPSTTFAPAIRAPNGTPCCGSAAAGSADAAVTLRSASPNAAIPPMGDHVPPPSRETSSFPMSSPFASISAIWASSNGPKILPDRRLTL